MRMARLSGLRVASEFSLPDLPEGDDPGAPADLTIRLGAVPRLDVPEEQQTKLLQVAADGTCRFEIEAVAAYRVDPEGREIVIEPHMPETAPDIRVFLYGTVFAIVCFRRGLLPLHASCVCIDGKAVAFSGVSGAGKSTQAAVFHKKGIPVLCDDVLVVDTNGAVPLVHPTFPRLKLWRDMMDGCAFPTEGLERTRAQLEKFHLPLDGFLTDPVPLSTVYFLEERRPPRAEGFFPIPGVDGFLALDRGIYRRAVGYRLLGAERIFAMTGKLLSTLKLMRLCRHRTLPRAAEIADEILRREGGA